jgi:hypothetical protein
MDLLSYLQYNETLNPRDIGLNPQVYRNIFECINKLKFKYGFMLRKMLSYTQIPFLISGVETIVGPNNSLHKIKFTRTDGKALEGLFQPESLMQIISSLTSALKFSMEQGIFNLNDITVDNYLKINEDVTKYINSIIKNQSEVKIDTEVAASIEKKHE